MQLIQDLSSGFSTAPNGTAQVYARGTSTPVTYYTDAEGYSSVTAGTAVTLDSQGAAEIYVNQVVRLLVLNAAGTTVSDTVIMDASPLTEVRSLSFAGTDYLTAQAADGNPTTLQSVLDKVKPSFGTTDWNVLVNGASVTLQSALASGTGLYFNVRGYGALGDGTTDDSAAITSAITAAAVAGGTVYFPPADASSFYRIETELTVPDNVNFLGAGTQASVIKIDAAGQRVVVTSVTPTGTQAYQSFRNLTMEAAQSNAVYVIEATTVMPMLIHNCKIGGSLNGSSTAILGLTTAGASVVANECVFVVASDNPVYEPAVVVDAVFNDCRFIGTVQARTQSLIDPDGTVTLNHCTFDASAATSGTHILLAMTDPSLASVRMSGCSFLGGTGATVTAMTTPALGGGVTVKESGSTFDANIDTRFVTSIDVSSWPTITADTSLGSRDAAFTGVTVVAGGTVTIDTQQYGNHSVQLTGTGTTQTISSTVASGGSFPVAPLGSQLSVSVRNAGSNTVTISFSSLHFNITSPGTILAGGVNVYLFSYQPVSTSGGRWVSSGVST